ncbi:hypothetical protein ACQKOE_07835 [Novosphingobium sp. NPDC080210]|uniref:hypothetical protein n=1 Tax=Novosphingobium sp. NPDC080210 TaxID=3390596 RepID=UPI003D006A9C
MKRLPIDLSLKTVTTKVSAAAWDRAQELKAKHDCRLSDIVSACLLYMPEEEIARIIAEQDEAVERLPKPVRALLRNMDKLTEDERAMIRDLMK